MDYFLIKPDLEYTDAPQLADLNQKLETTAFYNNQSYLMPMRTVVRLFANEHMDFTDYLYQFIPLFSERAIKVIQRFDDDFIHKQIILVDFKNAENSLYYLPFFPRFPAEVILEPDSTYALERTDPVVEIKLKVPYILPVFFVFWKRKCLPFMRLDVAESLLRNGCRGFLLREIKVFVEEG
jgi:hypothetical protein